MLGRGPLLFGTIVIVTAIGAFACGSHLAGSGGGRRDESRDADGRHAAGRRQLLIASAARPDAADPLHRPGRSHASRQGAGSERTVPLTLVAGAHIAQYFDLEAKTAASVASPARLSIVTDPPGARVGVDGRPRGVSPLVLEDLAAARAQRHGDL